MVRLKSEKIFNVVNIILISLLSLSFLLPVALILSASVSTAASFSQYGYTLIPKEFDLFAYEYVLVSNPLFLRSLWNSIFITVVGTFLMVVNTTLFSYALTKKELVGRKFFSFYAIFTMLFAGGTIPYYLVVTAWNILLTRNFFANLPESMLEAAELDGAGHVNVLLRVVLPTSFPVIATVILFTAVG